MKKKTYEHRQSADRRKWREIETGQRKDDYHNIFLSHFGFYDYNQVDNVRKR